MSKKIDVSCALEHLPAPLSEAISARIPENISIKRRLAPVDAKTAVVVAAGAAAALALVSTCTRASVYRHAVAREMKRCLVPVQKQLEELKAENARLAAILENQQHQAVSHKPEDSRVAAIIEQKAEG